ncbi:MAG: glycosyltransferase [Candidatus Riflebacteria bacterium]|nr:glycosyltransferase [Candidatus Riflebacteria bacterium]
MVVGCRNKKELKELICSLLLGKLFDTLKIIGYILLVQGQTPDHSPGRSLLIQGWMGINHSYALVNQYQLLSFIKDKSINLFHQEMPYFSKQWSKEKNGAGFTDQEQQQFSNVKNYSGEPISAIYRIYSPFNLENSEVKIVSFINTEVGLDQKSFGGNLDIRSYQSAGNLVVTSSAWSRERIIDFGFSPESVLVVPHGVSSNKFSPLEKNIRNASRVALGYTENDVVFLNVGAPFWNKGMDLILKAYFRVREKRKNVHLLIKDQQTLYGLSAQNMIGKMATDGEIKLDNGAIESIKIIPSTLSLEQLRTLYGLADYYISPYRAEGFNLPVIEAIACGTKAIVTAGGSTDDFCDNLTSIKVPSTKHEHLVLQNTKISAYLEPDFDALVEIWNKCAKGSCLNSLHFSFGRCDLLEKFTWDRAARLLTTLI